MPFKSLNYTSNFYIWHNATNVVRAYRMDQMDGERFWILKAIYYSIFYIVYILACAIMLWLGTYEHGHFFVALWIFTLAPSKNIGPDRLCLLFSSCHLQLVISKINQLLVILTNAKQKINYLFCKITSSRWLEIFSLSFSK